MLSIIYSQMQNKILSLTLRSNNSEYTIRPLSVQIAGYSRKIIFPSLYQKVLYFYVLNKFTFFCGQQLSPYFTMSELSRERKKRVYKLEFVQPLGHVLSLMLDSCYTGTKGCDRLTLCNQYFLTKINPGIDKQQPCSTLQPALRADSTKNYRSWNLRSHCQHLLQFLQVSYS